MKKIITSSIVTAMKEKDSAKLSILRVLKGEIERLEQDPKKGKIEVSDDVIFKTIKSLIENTNDSYEKEVLLGLLPEQLNEVDTKEIIDFLISDLGISKMDGMKVIIGHFEENYSGSYDKNLVSSYAKNKIMNG